MKNEYTVKTRTKKFDELGILIVMIALFVFLAIATPYFLKVENIQNLLLQSIFVMLVGFGMTFVLTIGGIDLSVGSILGYSGAVTGMIIAAGGSVFLGILAGLLTGAAFGLVNGLLITQLRIAPFLVTFAMSSVVRGILLLSTTNGAVSGFAVPEFTYLAQGYLFGLPIPVIITIIVFVILLFLFKFTSFGRNVTAIGSNREVAFLSGVSCNKITVGVYMLSGLLAALSGILLAARLTAVQSEMGGGYEMDAIAAAVIGGTSMAGGKGSIIGAIIGAVILGTISNGLDLLSVNQFYRQIIVGAIIVVGKEKNRSSASGAADLHYSHDGRDVHPFAKLPYGFQSYECIPPVGVHHVAGFRYDVCSHHRRHRPFGRCDACAFRRNDGMAFITKCKYRAVHYRRDIDGNHGRRG